MPWIDLLELLEQPLQIFRLDADPGVRNHQPKIVLVDPSGGHLNRAAFVGEFNRVRKEVVKNLFKTVPVEYDFVKIWVQSNADPELLFLSGEFEGRIDIVDGFGDRERR